MAEALTYEDLVINQRKEKKELMAKAQKMKHSIPKGDKKKKKDMTAEITQMLADLDIKHEEELKDFQDQHPSVVEELQLSKESSLLSIKDDDENNPNLHQLTETDKTESASEQGILNSSVPPKQSKAQKRRNRKAECAKERERAIAEQQIINLSGNRYLEFVEITKKLADRDLVIHEVPSDGNCLYNAIEHQMSAHNLEKLSMKSLRKLTAEYLLGHKEDFIPFLTNPDTDEIFSDEQFVKYCYDIMYTSAWGGHVEVQVLSNVCGKPIEVIQAEGPSIIAGNENEKPKLIISYHKHAFGLGEHFNSVILR